MRKTIGLLASASFAVLPIIGHAATPTLSDVLGASGITESGYIDAGYSASNFNSVNNVGMPNNNSFTLNQVALTLAKLPTEGFGGLVNVSLGHDANYINRSYGDNTSNFAVTQAFVQYATGGLTVMGGRFVSIAGEESIDQTKDANATRSLLFSSIQPRTLTGARASYKINDQVSVIGGLSNTAGLASDVPGGAGLLPFPLSALNPQGSMAVDANPQKAIELGVTFAPMSNLSMALSHYRETSGTGQGGRADVTDFVANFQPLKPLSLGLNADYFHIPNGAGTGLVAKGAALYAGYQFCDQLKGTMRGEYVQFLTGGNSARAKELTYTVDYTAAKNFNLLAEYRYDHADAAGLGKVLGSTATVKAIYSF